MQCIYCGCIESKVIDSRPNDDSSTIRRRRECMQCGKRFTTYEKVEELIINVLKKDGHREPFDIQKIFFGVQKSCAKLPVTHEDIQTLVHEVERAVMNSMEQEITTDRIGELILLHLRKLNQVAYIRFAAVYRSFQDVDSFMLGLNELREE